MPPDDDDQDQNDGTDLVDRRHIRALEEKAAKADALEARLVTMEKESAFARALGTATEQPWFTYFQKGYEGELTTEAIRQAATDAGFARAPAETSSPTEPVQNPDDLAAHQRLAQAAAGAAPPPPFDPAAEIAKATSQEEILAIIARCDPDKYGVTGPIVT